MLLVFCGIYVPPRGTHIMYLLCNRDKYISLLRLALGMRGAIISYVREHWEELDLSFSPSDVQMLVQNRYGQLTFFILDRQRIIAIACASPRDPSKVKWENELLQKIHGQVSPALSRCIPRPLGVFVAKGLPVSVRSFIPGNTMAQDLSARTLNAHLHRANAWLIDFNRHFPVRLGSIDRLQRNMVPKLKRLGIGFPRLSDGVVPLSPKHTDFWPGNIILGETLGVLDWEHFGDSNLPLFDLFHFMVSSSLALGSDDLRAFHRMFFTETVHTKYLRSEIQRACNALNIPSVHVHSLFLLYLAEFYLLRLRQEGERYSVTQRSRQFLVHALEERCVL